MERPHRYRRHSRIRPQASSTVRDSSKGLTLLILDTDIAVDLLRGFPSATAWLTVNAHQQIGLPGYVVMELIQGCFNQQEVFKVQHFVRPFRILWPAPHVNDQAVTLYARGRLSHNLGLLDALIGQLALSLNSPLHTFNQKHFAAIPTLQTIQPYIR